MKILHILKSEPDETTEQFIQNLAGDKDETTVQPLFLANVASLDWHRLLDDIFSHEKVICWW